MRDWSRIGLGLLDCSWIVSKIFRSVEGRCIGDVLVMHVWIWLGLALDWKIGIGFTLDWVFGNELEDWHIIDGFVMDWQIGTGLACK